jgi:DNA invertase Pin-like site-specific DNA recombinase
MDRCVIYCRVSTEGQRDNYSLPEQERMCLERAQERGYHVVKVIKEAHSGADVDRPGMNEVLDLAHEGKFNVLLVSDLDRFARDMAPKILLKKELTECGVRIEYVLKDFSNDSTGELLEDILSAFAAHERRTIVARSKRGKSRVHPRRKSGNLWIRLRETG